MFLVLFIGCAADCERRGLAAGDHQRCRVDGWDDREVLVHVPASWDGTTALPLVVARHGHSGTAANFDSSTCSEGEEGGPNCLSTVADEEGFVVAYADGTGNAAGLSRSWNAGGGEDGWRCVGDPACEDGVDDVAYDDDLFSLLTEALPIDEARVFATGMSNGAAMSHRLACERSHRYAAVVAVAGANQASAAPGCAPTAAVPILQIHGTEDPCWGWDGSAEGVCEGDGEPYVSVDASMEFWRTANGCAETTTEEVVEDVADDGMTTSHIRWDGCAAAVELLRTEDGGHTWPGGSQYLSADLVGGVTGDYSASRAAWAFFDGVP